jgi:hypothetical protein
LKDIKEALDKYKKEGIGCLNNINIWIFRLIDKI